MQYLPEKSYLIMCLSCDVAEVVVTMGLRVFVNYIIRGTKCARITLIVKINCGFLNDFFLKFTFRKKHTSVFKGTVTKLNNSMNKRVVSTEHLWKNFQKKMKLIFSHHE